MALSQERVATIQSLTLSLPVAVSSGIYSLLRFPSSYPVLSAQRAVMGRRLRDRLFWNVEAAGCSDQQ